MTKKRVLLTGASGNMGRQAVTFLKEDLSIIDLTLFSLDDELSRQQLSSYENTPGIEVVYGDLLDADLVATHVKKADIVIHLAAFVSPAADEFPEKAMKINYGSTRNLIAGIKAAGREMITKFVYIGTVAQTGDRMPPVHWGRVGDPIKPSIYDYYAVSKVASERMVIESGLKYWASLRQTGILSASMSQISDPIAFHNCLDNVLEYVSDRDSGRLVRNICTYDAKGETDKGFWQHIYNIGGGESCRVSAIEMYREVYGKIGLTNLDEVIDPRWYATTNFHGQYYFDSDKLEDYFHFRQDSMDYFYQSYLDNLGIVAPISKVVTKLPFGQKIIGSVIKGQLKKVALKERGTLRFIEDNDTEKIEAFWGSKANWEKIPAKLSDVKFQNTKKISPKLNHGYDETKEPNLLSLKDMVGAASFRGGTCLSIDMKVGDWESQLRFKCGFGHEFHGSPKLILEGGHWCPVCERESWNYGERAKRDPFFAQVWNPTHASTEMREYPKIISEVPFQFESDKD